MKTKEIHKGKKKMLTCGDENSEILKFIFVGVSTSFVSLIIEFL